MCDRTNELKTLIYGQVGDLTGVQQSPLQLACCCMWRRNKRLRRFFKGTTVRTLGLDQPSCCVMMMGYVNDCSVFLVVQIRQCRIGGQEDRRMETLLSQQTVDTSLSSRLKTSFATTSRSRTVASGPRETSSTNQHQHRTKDTDCL